MVSSFDCPKVVVVSALMTLSLSLAFLFMLSVCCLNVIRGSSVSPSMVGVGLIGIGVLSRCTIGCALISCLQGVMSVSDDLFAETLSLFVSSHFSSERIYFCMLVAAVLYSLCCEEMVRSSAYDMTFMFVSVGLGMSCMYRLNSDGESTKPCGTPFL